MLPSKRRKLILPDKPLPELVKVAFFDADRTLRVTHSRKRSPQGQQDVKILTQAFPALKKLYERDYLLAIVSNQAGIGLGIITEAEVEDAMQETIRQFASKSIYFSYYDFAKYYDNNRKPELEMAWRLEHKLKLAGKGINWPESFMVGDAAWQKGKDLRPDGQPGTDHSNSDRLFAENIAKKHPGFRFFHPENFYEK